MALRSIGTPSAAIRACTGRIIQLSPSLTFSASSSRSLSVVAIAAASLPSRCNLYDAHSYGCARRHEHRNKSTMPQRSSTNTAATTAWTTDMFRTLRRKAADVLTASLSPQERQELLQRLGPSTAAPSVTVGAGAVPEGKLDNGDDNVAVAAAVDIETSIREAVVAARAQEAQRQQEVWEKEKARFMAEAEQAALARVESDLAIQKRRIAFEQWKQQVEQQQQQQQQQLDGVKEDAEPVVAVPSEEQHSHPVLGPALVDLGYKRIHLASVKVLASIPVWKKQRIYRHDRAKAMAADKMKTLRLGMPGVITLHEDSTGKLCILDGQHRVGMLSILSEKAGSLNGLDLDRVLVEVFPQNQEEDEEHVEDIFVEINKAEPVKLVDMPGVAKSGDRKIITEAASRLKEGYPDMFSPSERCRAPHLNIDNLRDALFASEVIKRHGLKSAKALENWLLEQNKLMEEKYRNEEVAKNVSKTALAKASSFAFYLGLDPSWLYH